MVHIKVLKIMKRTGKEVLFEKNKIVKAIEKAMESSSGVYIENQAQEIADEIEKFAYQTKEPLTIEDVEELVYLELIKRDNPATARAYEEFKIIQSYKRERNRTDKEIYGLLNGTDKELINENSNKDASVVSTQRDLIAGEVVKDIAKRLMIPWDLLEAHQSGAIHIHDMDYIIQPMFNCCIINMKDMLEKGTVVNDKLIETPKSFQVACNVMTQIIAQIASNQYGLPV